MSAETLLDSLGIPDDVLEDMCVRMCEHTEDHAPSQEQEEGEDGYVWVSDIHKHNALNKSMTGVFWWGGIEYSFECSSGDWNGFSWDFLSADEPIPEMDYRPTTFTIIPANTTCFGIDDPVERAKAAKHLLTIWDLFLEKDSVQEMIRNYMYDRHFQPGGNIEGYYRDKASAISAQLVPQDEADELRDSLTRAASYV